MQWLLSPLVVAIGVSATLVDEATSWLSSWFLPVVFGELGLGEGLLAGYHMTVTLDILNRWILLCIFILFLRNHQFILKIDLLSPLEIHCMSAGPLSLVGSPTHHLVCQRVVQDVIQLVALIFICH